MSIATAGAGRKPKDAKSRTGPASFVLLIVVPLLLRKLAVFGCDGDGVVELTVRELRCCVLVVSCFTFFPSAVGCNLLLLLVRGPVLLAVASFERVDIDLALAVPLVPCVSVVFRCRVFVAFPVVSFFTAFCLPFLFVLPFGFLGRGL